MPFSVRFRVGLALDRVRAWIGVPMECDRGGPSDASARSSPDGALVLRIGDKEALLCYGRPYANGRTVFGELVPFGELWRLGANEPTVLHLPLVAEVAGLRLSRGRYSLYAVPERGSEWTLVVNRSTRQWGLTRPERGRAGRLFQGAYSDAVRAAEVGRVDIEVRKIPYVEQLTARTEPRDSTLTVLLLEWETTQMRVPIRALP